MPSADALRVSRALASTEQDIAVGAADGVFLPANPSRIGLLLCPALANNVTISWDGAALLGQGINLVANGSPVFVSIEQMGSLITQACRAIGSLATTITVFELTGTAG